MSVLAVEDGPIFAVLVSQVWLIGDLLLSVLRSHQVGVVFRLSALISPLWLFLPQLQKFFSFASLVILGVFAWSAALFSKIFSMTWFEMDAATCPCAYAGKLVVMVVVQLGAP